MCSWELPFSWRMFFPRPQLPLDAPSCGLIQERPLCKIDQKRPCCQEVRLPEVGKRCERQLREQGGLGGSARPQGRHGLDRGMYPVGQPASCLIIGWKRNASARVRPVFADARSASLREDGLQRRPQVLLPRPSVMRWPRRGGAGSARPQRRHRANPNVASLWPLGHRQPMLWK